MFTLLSELVSGVGSSNALNTKKIDRNIEKLLESDWFNKIYTNERYRNLFFPNKRIRYHLQSSRRAQNIIRSEKAQKKLLFLLEKELK
ncbi:hypothetical protein [Planococcus beijingensis]|uniref:hypothetical protein n=1 Tax=Planococcus beijingensis TaxID=2782551 RepID=UPI00193B1253|nr:hypothetical protein [Planococcus beijingensis]